MVKQYGCWKGQAVLLFFSFLFVFKYEKSAFQAKNSCTVDAYLFSLEAFNFL